MDNKEKTREAISCFVTQTNYCSLGKLFRLLYFMDFTHFMEAGRSVTGLEYTAHQYGAIPCVLWQKIIGDSHSYADVAKELAVTYSLGQIYERLGKQVPTDCLSNREKRIISSLSSKYILTPCCYMDEGDHFESRPSRVTFEKYHHDGVFEYLTIPYALAIRE